MSELPHLPTTPPEVSLLLRAHAEQGWLNREVLPVVRQVETREGLVHESLPNEGLTHESLPLESLPHESLPAEQLPAALAYLEVVWAEAVRRAGETDGACTCLDLALPAPDPVLGTKARRYRAAVVVVREGVGRRVGALLSAEPSSASPEGRAPRSCNL